MASTSSAQVESSANQDAAREEDDAEFWSRVQHHQRSVPSLSTSEDARTVIDRCTRGAISTFSTKHPGFPFSSPISFASDEQGRPLLSISSLSAHTKDLLQNGACCLLVSRDLSAMSETVVAVTGRAVEVPAQEVSAARQLFLSKLPDAFWVDFGDFRFLRIQPEHVRVTSNVATNAMGASVNEFSGEQYMASAADPIAPFEKPIADHMNKDHEASVIAMVEYALKTKVPSAKILTVDRYGMRIEVPLRGELSRLRIPFPRPAEDRKDVKTLIVEMTRAAAGAGS